MDNERAGYSLSSVGSVHSLSIAATPTAFSRQQTVAERVYHIPKMSDRAVLSLQDNPNNNTQCHPPTSGHRLQVAARSHIPASQPSSPE